MLVLRVVLRLHERLGLDRRVLLVQVLQSCLPVACVGLQGGLHAHRVFPHFGKLNIFVFIHFLVMHLFVQEASGVLLV